MVRVGPLQDSHFRQPRQRPGFPHAAALKQQFAQILRDTYSGGVLQTDSRLYYLSDANANVTAVVGTAGNTWQVVERYVYSPYGEATIYTPDWSSTRTTSAYNNTTLFAGRELDLSTGLYYNRARYYSADLGSFVGRDPIGYAGGDANLYRYVENQPVMYTDPQGLWNEGNSGDKNLPSASRGHSDFYNPNLDFNYNTEDTSLLPRPENPFATYRHFMKLEDAEADILKAIKRCDKDGFERAMHRMQDYYSHRGQGYESRGYQPILGTVIGGAVGGAATGGPVGIIVGAGGGLVWGIWHWGHVGDTAKNGRLGAKGLRPDDADDFRDAYVEANKRTKMWVDRWYASCNKSDNGRWTSKPGRCEEDLDKPLKYDAYQWAEEAPPGRRVPFAPASKQLTPAQIRAIEKMYNPRGGARPAGGW